MCVCTVDGHGRDVSEHRQEGLGNEDEERVHSLADEYRRLRQQEAVEYG